MMKAAVYVDRRKIETRDHLVPELGSGDVLLKVHACGVCGTDVVKVRFHLVDPPTVLGHEVAGVVKDVGKDVTKFNPGDRVVVAHHYPCYTCHYCRHENFSMCRTFKRTNLDPGGFAEYLRIPAQHVEKTARRIPDGMSFETAIFMEPLACILRNVKRAQVLQKDTCLVVGLGSVGLMTGQVLRDWGARVVATDLREDRLILGRRLGFESTVNAEKESELRDQLDYWSEGRGADLVILTAGTSESYAASIGHLRDGGKLSIFAGVGPGTTMELPIDEIYKRELTIFSSYSPSPAELVEALDLLDRSIVNVEILKARLFGLNETQDAIESAISQNVLKAIVCPETRNGT